MNLLYTLALTSVYIYNSLGQYLSVGKDGKPAISDKPVAMDVTAANETPSKDANRWNFDGKDIKWILKSSADSTYTLGYQDRDAYSTAFVYTLNGALATSYEEPAATFESAQWKVSTEAPKQQAVTLDEAQNYVRPTFTGSYVDVTLKRKFNTNEWNTLCLPFPLSAAQIAELWGAGSKVAILTGDSETKLFFSTCDNIEAGKPCLLDPKNVNADHTYEIKDIEVSTWENNSERQYVAGKTRMVGFFSPTMVKEGSYVFGDANKMYHLVSDMEAKGFRCYFEDVAGASRVLTWGIDDNTTGIDGTFVTPQAPKVGNIYTVNGQLVRRNSTAAGLAPGVYIMNGIKLIVK